MFKKLTIMGRLGAAFGLLLDLLVACAGVGVVGLNMLCSTADHAVANDVQIAQRASSRSWRAIRPRRVARS